MERHGVVNPPGSVAPTGKAAARRPRRASLDYIPSGGNESIAPRRRMHKDLWETHIATDLSDDEDENVFNSKSPSTLKATAPKVVKPKPRQRRNTMTSMSDLDCPAYLKNGYAKKTSGGFELDNVSSFDGNLSPFGAGDSFHLKGQHDKSKKKGVTPATPRTVRKKAPAHRRASAGPGADGLRTTPRTPRRPSATVTASAAMASETNWPSGFGEVARHPSGSFAPSPEKRPRRRPSNDRESVNGVRKHPTTTPGRPRKPVKKKEEDDHFLAAPILDDEPVDVMSKPKIRKKKPPAASESTASSNSSSREDSSRRSNHSSRKSKQVKKVSSVQYEFDDGFNDVATVFTNDDGMGSVWDADPFSDKEDDAFSSVSSTRFDAPPPKRSEQRQMRRTPHVVAAAAATTFQRSTSNAHAKQSRRASADMISYVSPSVAKNNRSGRSERTVGDGSPRKRSNSATPAARARRNSMRGTAGGAPKRRPSAKGAASVAPEDPRFQKTAREEDNSMLAFAKRLVSPRKQKKKMQVPMTPKTPSTCSGSITEPSTCSSAASRSPSQRMSRMIGSLSPPKSPIRGFTNKMARRASGSAAVPKTSCDADDAASVVSSLSKINKRRQRRGTLQW